MKFPWRPGEALRGGLFYNYLFVVFELIYYYLFRDRLLDDSVGAVYAVRRAPLLGALIGVFLAAEIFAMTVKGREFRAAGRRPLTGVLFVLWVLHWVTAVMMSFTAVQCFGIDVSKESSGGGGAVVIAAILASMVHAGAVMGVIVRLREPIERPPSPKASAAAGAAAFLFSCVAYTVIWETIVFHAVSKTGRLDIMTFTGALSLTGWGLSFLLLYPPLRLPFLLGETADLGEGRDRTRILLGYAAVIVAGVIPLVKRPF